MDVETRVEKLLAARTFTTESARCKTREFLLKSLGSLEVIDAYDEDDAYENAPSDVRNDDSDGVPCTTIAEFNKRQQDKRTALRNRSTEFFSADELETENVGGGIATATLPEVDRKLKWGYTALHFAAISGDKVECERLLSLGASKTVRENGGKMPWQKAELKGFTELAEFLKP
jgi:hypothetical protein